MSFRTNSFQQFSLTDSFQGLTAREQKALNNSWAKVFAEDLFPYIDETPYASLYSTKYSRPNTPVNVLLGSLIIKEMFNLSDDQVQENLMLDIRYQYALHTTSYEEQPLSDKSLSRFRVRCYNYETATGIDLIHDTMTSLSSCIAKVMNISPNIKRMDSMMIEANIKKLSRMELLYTCIARLCIYLHKKAKVSLPEELMHYTEENDFNKVIYHNRSEEVAQKLLTLLKDADTLFALCGSDYDETEEYQLFVRCLGEQTIVEENTRRLRTKEDGTMYSNMLQNPSDPSATFRTKAGKEHRGFAANVVESVGENGSLVTDYQVEKNTYSDSQFLKDYVNTQEVSETPVTMVTDGAYSGEGNKEAAEEKNINLITTDLSGKAPDTIVTEFTIHDEAGRILICPAGYAPLKSRFDAKTETYLASFPSECCRQCPHKDRCHAKIHSRVANVKVGKKSIARAEAVKYRETEEFKNLARIRNGVETIPSLLRNRYQVDRMPRGLQKVRFYFGCKIAALNFRKLFTFRKGRGNYAQNPLLSAVAC